MSDHRIDTLPALMRESADRLSWSLLQPDANLTKQICALCGSWVWDDSEENQKPVQHKPGCLITRLRSAADQMEATPAYPHPSICPECKLPLDGFKTGGGHHMQCKRSGTL